MAAVLADEQHFHHSELHKHDSVAWVLMMMMMMMIIGMAFVSNKLFIRRDPQSATGKSNSEGLNPKEWVEGEKKKKEKKASLIRCLMKYKIKFVFDNGW